MTPAIHPPVVSPDDVDLQAMCQADVLLVALDFDGVIAPLQDDPTTVAPLPGSARAVADIAALQNTPVGYISGRNMAVLQDLSKAPTGALFIGSHGLETDFSALDASPDEASPDDTPLEEAPLDEAPLAEALAHPETSFSTPLTDEETRALEELDAAIEGIRAAAPTGGSGELRVERKPLGRTAHTRGVSAERAEFFETQLAHVAQRMPHLRSFSGHKMTEFAVRMETKGDGLRRMLEASGADAVIFLGDDTTDEDAFQYLIDRPQLPSLPIKVGTQETCATHRIADPEAVAAFLTRLAAQRAAALADRG